MTYESTGEVRHPQLGEFALCNGLCYGVHKCEDPQRWGYAVIMRPVRVEEPTELCRCVVIPFGEDSYLDVVKDEIREKTGYSSLIKTLELTQEELRG